MRQTGSSPLARGAPWPTRAASSTPRIIPACAGSTRSARTHPRSTGDHPRLRGEHLDIIIEHAGVPGSSPLARGARGCVLALLLAERIIPACAGSTGGAELELGVDGDHPRLRGEHPLRTPLMAGHRGSSPLARGAPLGVREHAPIGGIIPACAGSTPRRGARRRGPGDHPRLRGEHEGDWFEAVSFVGSSPLARGAPSRAAASVKLLRIIPACAGSTVLAAVQGAALEIIPACAGSTYLTYCPVISSWDHPRLRGEHI